MPDVDNVKCASFVLKNEACYWWETVAIRRDVKQMTWANFVEEFNEKFFNKRAINAQQKEFNEIKQESMTVSEAVTKFNQLARLCHRLVPIEEETVRRMMKMFKPDR